MHEEFIAEITFILVLKPENDFSMHWPPDCLAILARALIHFPPDLLSHKEIEKTKYVPHIKMSHTFKT